MRLVFALSKIGVLKRASLLLIEKIFSLGAALAIQVVLARYLGPSQFGVLNYVSALVALLNPIATLGLNQIVSKSLIDADEPGDVLGTVAVLRAAGAIGASLILFSLLIIPSFQGRETWLAGLVCLFSVFGSLNFLQYWFNNVDKLSYFTIASIINSLLFSAARLVGVVLGAPLEFFVVTIGVEQAGLGLFALFAYRLTGINNRWRFDRAKARHLLSRTWILIVSSLAATIYLKLDTVMIRMIAGDREAGIYAVAARLSEIWYFLPTLAMTALLPSMLRARKDKPKRYMEMLQLAFDIMSMSASVIAIIIALSAHYVVPILYGAAYEKSASILVVHVWAGVFVFMRAPLINWLIAEDKLNVTLMRTLVAMVISVAMNSLLIPRFAGLGAAVSTLTSYAVAHYITLLFTSETRSIFIMMTKSLFWPLRIKSIIIACKASFRFAGTGRLRA